ncbi:hypothetical protein E2C01_003261 [Portunus trituberculatus]|uniref:Uncharacterized protein n=1 Tax=Portunus trituberculatus TaxID=210409 RepID=A0A5B7CLR0_PORTR|nr:hypothetical protein [Portunus trituberculatus]
MEGWPRVESDGLWALADTEMKLHIAHKTRVAVRERQVANDSQVGMKSCYLIEVSLATLRDIQEARQRQPVSSGMAQGGENWRGWFTCSQGHPPRELVFQLWYDQASKQAVLRSHFHDGHVLRRRHESFCQHTGSRDKAVLVPSFTCLLLGKGRTGCGGGRTGWGERVVREDGLRSRDGWESGISAATCGLLAVLHLPCD